MATSESEREDNLSWNYGNDTLKVKISLNSEIDPTPSGSEVARAILHAIIFSLLHSTTIAACNKTHEKLNQL